MSELRKANTDHTYFITLTIVGWIDLFSRYRYSDLIINNLNYCIKNKGLEVFAYVIMPSHVHLVARQKEGKLNNVLRDFKSYTAKEILKLIETEPGESRKDWLLYMFSYFAKGNQQNSEHQVWQKTNHPTELLDGKMVTQKIEYIHQNPVRAQIVQEPNNYIYSSANTLQQLLLEKY